MWLNSVPSNNQTPHMKKKNYAGSEKPLPTLIREKEPLWY
jgi:hypothetical protein